jgi:hypothetical protein
VVGGPQVTAAPDGPSTSARGADQQAQMHGADETAQAQANLCGGADAAGGGAPVAPPSEPPVALDPGTYAHPRPQPPGAETTEEASDDADTGAAMAAARTAVVGAETDAAAAGDAAPPAGATAIMTPDAPASSPVSGGGELAALGADLAALRDQVGALSGALEQVIATTSDLPGIAEAVADISRLRRRDTELADRLHSDVTRLRAGEIAQAITPVVLGMLKVHDQMVSLGAVSDPASVAGLLHAQLLQSLELTAGVKPYHPAVDESFDPRLHTGLRRVPASSAAADGTIARTIKVGFTRADGSVVRTAEVEVLRLST